MRVYSPLLSTIIDKARPSHVGTYGVEATKYPSTRDFHATGNTRTRVQKHPNTQHISTRGLQGRGNIWGKHHRTHLTREIMPRGIRAAVDMQVFFLQTGHNNKTLNQAKAQRQLPQLLTITSMNHNNTWSPPTRIG